MSNSKGMNICNWLGARDFYRKCRSKDEGRPTGSRGTRVVVSRQSPSSNWKADDCVYAIKYHYSEVVRYYPNGDVGIDMCDWDSVTTKARIRQHSNANVGSYKGTMHLHWSGPEGGLSIPIRTDREYILLRDGGVRLPDGKEVKDGVTRCAAPTRASKTRNKLTNPVPGEVLVNADGDAYLLFSAPQSRYPLNHRTPIGVKTLRRYLGDYELDRDYVFLGESIIVINELFLLSMTDWTSGSRFIRSFDN